MRRVSGGAAGMRDSEDILVGPTRLHREGHSPSVVSRKMAWIGATERLVEAMSRWPSGIGGKRPSALPPYP